MNTDKSSLSSFSDAAVGYNKQSTSQLPVWHLLPVAMQPLPTPLCHNRALYGKVKSGEDDDTLLTGPSPPPNVTPMPTPAFFESQFWRRFQLQRESRYINHTQRAFTLTSYARTTPASFVLFPHRPRHRISRIRRSFYCFSEWKVRLAWYHRQTLGHVACRLGVKLRSRRERSVDGPLGGPHIPVP